MSSAFPQVNWIGDKHVEHGSLRLSKRELFAALAMQGQLAAPDIVDSTPAGVARWSVAYADALLAELAKEPQA